MLGVYAAGTTIYAATSSGLSISTDDGASFSNRTTAQGLGSNGVYGVYAEGTAVYAATTAGLAISTNGGASFTNRTTADGLGSDAVYSVHADGTMVCAATGAGLSISTNSGASFVNRTTANGLGSNTVHDVHVMWPTIYAATQNGLAVSFNGGASFINRTTANGLGSNIVRDVYAVGATVYAATDNGLAISTDSGSSFSNRTDGYGLGDNHVVGVYALGATVYAATHNGLSISTDGGGSFLFNYSQVSQLRGVVATATGINAATLNGLAICPPPRPEIELKGNGMTIADGATSTNGLDGTYFGSVAVVGGTAARNFTIENLGRLTLNLTGTPRVALSGAHAADFTVTTQPASSVAAGGTTTFVVTSAQPANQTVCAGSPASFSVTATGSGLTYQWRKNGANIAGATAATYNITAATTANAGSYDVVITSSCGTLTSQAAALTINPATAITTQPANQSASVGQSATFSVTAEGASLTYQWRKNGAAISGATGSSYTIAAVTTADAGNYDVVVTGACGAVTSKVAVLTVTAECSNPAVSITAPAVGGIFATGVAVNFTGSFTDASGATHTATWTFDSITRSGVVNEAMKTVSASYTFTKAGVYLVTLTVNNSCGGQGSASLIGGHTAMVVVYGANAGFVAGNGWITSPAGAYVPDPSLTGAADFGFVAKYKKGSSAPTGETEFQFQVANFRLNSTAYEWLVVAGAKAQFKGSGTVNGAGSYGFILTAIDGQLSGGGGQDKFRIKVWNNAGGAVVYDNQMGASDSADPTTVIGGGQVAIQTGGNGNNLAAPAAQVAGAPDGEGQSRNAEVDWQIIVGNEGEAQSVLSGGSEAPHFDMVVLGDYDGDGATDLGIFRRATGQWLIQRSADGGLTQLQ